MLPIDALADAVRAALPGRRAVISAPTGSGKSTQVPRWCADIGRVLVVEPRRVAARGLAQRVSHLEGSELGDRVGYRVRDDSRASGSTAIVFATPGVVLRMAAAGDLARFSTVILDEFHERTLDTDLLLALLLKRYDGALLVMSATLDGDRIATHIGGPHLQGEGRTFPVDRRYRPFGEKLPTDQGLSQRVRQALNEALDEDGDVLVFLPGKGEIERVADSLGGLPVELMKLHGQLPLDAQARVFAPGGQRRVILSTNVAETSVTVPRIGVVIDTGLVRRTRYHGGRGYLSLTAIAQDSAEQRAGRAGRTRAGVALHLWDATAPLLPGTPPELHRESLVPLLLAAAASGAPDLDLPFLDTPRDYAVKDARDELELLGALDASGLTDRGRALFGLPLPPELGRFLLEAEERGCLEDAIDLVAGLTVHKPLFRRERPEPDTLREEGCDASAIIRAIRVGEPGEHGLDRYALREARDGRRRLRRAWKLTGEGPRSTSIDRRMLAVTALRADPRSAYVARRRKRRVAWSNGGTEVSLGRYCAAAETEAEAVVAWSTRAMASGRQQQEIVITAATPCPLPWLIEAGVGADRVGRAKVERRVARAVIERVFAGKVLTTTEAVPTGTAAVDAIARLFLEGRIFKGTLPKTRDNLRAAALLARLEGTTAPPTVEDWVTEQVATLGVESGRDLALLSAEDLTFPGPPDHVRAQLDREFPREVSLPDARYELEYDPVGRTVTLRKVSGTRKTMPSLRYLPSLPGWRLLVADKSNVRVLRER